MKQFKFPWLAPLEHSSIQMLVQSPGALIKTLDWYNECYVNVSKVKDIGTRTTSTDVLVSILST